MISRIERDQLLSQTFWIPHIPPNASANAPSQTFVSGASAADFIPARTRGIAQRRYSSLARRDTFSFFSLVFSLFRAGIKAAAVSA
jgi:hypothetical protein